MIDIQRYEDPAEFLEDAEDWLSEAEAEHTLIIGIARQLCQSIAPYIPPIYFATVCQDRQIVGCAYRTPPFKFVMTRMPVDAVAALVDDVARIYGALPAAVGPDPVVSRFGALWSRQRGVRAEPGANERIYQLSNVRMPTSLPAGRLRLAEPGDQTLVVEWLGRFMEEAMGDAPVRKPVVEVRIDRRRVHLWDDDGPVSMACTTGRTRRGVRITDVYTPPELRGRGYASASVAHLSQRMLAEGLEFCCLYTDLANPTSNSIYRRIGYVPLLDVSEVVFPAR